MSALCPSSVGLRSPINLAGKKNDKGGFAGVAIMLTITIFATIVSDMLPVSNNTPLIGGFATLTITKNAIIDGYSTVGGWDWDW